MAINFGGGETSSFTCFNALEDTTVGTFRSPARCGIHIKKAGWIMATLPDTVSSQWFHFDLNIGLISNNLTPVQILSSNGAVIFSLSTNGNVTVLGTPIGSLNLFTTTGLRTIDIKLSGTSIEIYNNTRSVFTASGTFAITDIKSLRINPVGQDSGENTSTMASQVIASDEPTVGLELATLSLTAQGALAQWSGTVSSINETITNDTTFISSNSVDQYTTYSISTLPAQYTNVKAVIVNALARYTGSGPQNIEAVVRYSGTNYSQTMTPLGIGYTPSSRIYGNNPFTGIPWTNAEINGSQFGFRSRN